MTAIPTERIEQMEELATENIEQARIAVNKRLDTANRKIADVAEELRETAGVADPETSMLDKAKDFAREAKGIALEKKQLLEKKTHHVSDLARNSYGQMRGTASGLWTKTKHFALKNPVTSTAIAMGVAVVTGLAIRQARS